MAGLLHELDNPRVPQGCAAVGAEVEVLWPDEGLASFSSSCTIQTVLSTPGSTWHPARVCGVHADGTYTAICPTAVGAAATLSFLFHSFVGTCLRGTLLYGGSQLVLLQGAKC